MQDILVHMDAEGYYCSEDSILRYIKQLRNELGVDVISGRGRNARYFIGNRLLEKEEMKLIIDSVNASNFTFIFYPYFLFFFNLFPSPRNIFSIHLQNYRKRK